MLDGHILLVAAPQPGRELGEQLAGYRDDQEEETGERPSLRRAAFDVGADPLPGLAWLPPGS